MPEWVQSPSAGEYWKAAEGEHTRTNARTAVLMEFALPKGLGIDQQSALAMEMAEAVSTLGAQVETGNERDRSPVTLGLHEGHGRNPHVHLLLSTSINDGISRPQPQWFKRFKPEARETGGARRCRFLTKRRWLYQVRQLWARLANNALLAANLPASLDERSHQARGVPMSPTIHLGPGPAYHAARGTITPRAARNRKIEQLNDAWAELLDQIRRRQEKILNLELEYRMLEQDQENWRATRDHSWVELLRDHPFAKDASQLRSNMSVLALDEMRSNLPVLREAFTRLSADVKFAEAIGPSWDQISTPFGLWAVRPGHDEVVLMNSGYVVTDATDDDAIAAMLRVAKLLPFQSPTFLVEASSREQLQAQLVLADLDWPVRAPRETRSGPKM